MSPKFLTDTDKWIFYYADKPDIRYLTDNRCITTVHSIQYKAVAVPTLVAVPAVHSIQYKVAAVPTSVAVPTVQSGGNPHRELTKLAITHVLYRIAH